MKVNITHAYENVYTFPEFSWRIRITCDAFARKSSDTLIFAQFRAKREREKEKKNIRRTPRGLIIRVDFGPGLVSADRLADFCREAISIRKCYAAVTTRGRVCNI